eukprot:maker-scaffold299_size217019-snap-gene-1.31 protein:Tk09198 transcript:maker-scaffold299_size217019-snap-gene-1.31-mRNA-1 annotation:"lim domain and actin-binding protein 1"
MADVENGKRVEEHEEDEDEYEYEEVSEYEDETESEDEAVDKEMKKQASLESEESLEIQDPFPIKAKTTTQEPTPTVPKGDGIEEKVDKKEDGENGERRKHHHKKHKKSRHIEKFEAFNKDKSNDPSREKSHRRKIHVRSKDPASIAKHLERSLNGGSSGGKSKSGRGRPIPPQPKINTTCKICGKEPYVVERLVAEKSWWHKNCFRCKTCSKLLNLDTYMSHEGVIFCKPHHRELFQPKVVKDDIIEVKAKPRRRSSTEDAIERHKEQARKMETIVRENDPIGHGDDVAKADDEGDEAKFKGLENLDVGSKFKMFEKGGSDQAGLTPRVSTDRYGIMEKLKRLQEGEDLDDLLAEIDDEMPDDPVAEEDPDEFGMTAMEKKTHKAEMMFTESGQDRRDRRADQRRRELKDLRESLMVGNKEHVLDQFEDLLNSSANKVKKTRVDVRSENAKKFRDMFDKGEVPEGAANNADRVIKEKNHELEQMRKTKREQKEFFKKMEKGELDDPGSKPSEPKLLVGKFKDKSNGEEGDQGDMELASLSNRFSFFENYKEKEVTKTKKKTFRMSPSHEGEDIEGDLTTEVEEVRRHTTERDMARRDCKAGSVLKKFKEMEEKVLNGEDDVAEKRPMKRFTPPRKLGSETGSDYSDDEYSDSDSYTDSYTGSDYTDSDSESEEDETLKAIRATQRAKALRAKFEEWEHSQDAKEQERQMKLTDENGSSLDTASHLKKRFEALQLREEAESSGQQQQQPPKFRPKRFKVGSNSESRPFGLLAQGSELAKGLSGVAPTSWAFGRVLALLQVIQDLVHVLFGQVLMDMMASTRALFSGLKANGVSSLFSGVSRWRKLPGPPPPGRTSVVATPRAPGRHTGSEARQRSDRNNMIAVPQNVSPCFD